MASEMFEKFKARLVAGGNQQDKELYDNLSSPTASIASVFALIAIVAHEGRSILVIDIGGLFVMPTSPTWASRCTCVSPEPPRAC